MKAYPRFRILIALSIAIPLALIFIGQRAPAVRAQVPDDFAGLRVQGRHLYDRFGNKIVLVGVNKMVIWTDRDGMPAFSEIAKTGANAVRVVWLTEGTPEELDVALSNAISHRLIPIVDCHDSTGEWAKVGACVDYWTRPDVVPVLKRHADYLLINIANEAGSGVQPSLEFRAVYELAIRRIRAAGIHVPLVIDAQGYGQDIDDLQKNGPYLIQADPDHNLLFSIHMWWPSEWRGSNVDQRVIDEIAESVEMELPLLIGEFAHKAVGCVCCIPYRTIIEEAHANEIGYLPWSWGPGNSDCEQMDMTEDGTFETLHGWGLEVAITSPHSIQAIAVRPDWIVNATPVPTPTPAPTPTPIPAPEGLISTGKPVTASSVEREELTAANVVDGRLNTRWSSEYSDPQTITLDLGEVQPIARIVLVWETAYGKAYTLQVSDDGERWTDVVTVTNSDGGQDDHAVTTAGRYVRMVGEKRGTEWGYSLWEFWVFNRADVPLPEPDISGDVTTAPDERPDLVISAIRWSPGKITTEDAVTFEAVVENRGNIQTRLEPPVRCAFQIGGETVAWGEFRKPLAVGGSAVCTADQTPAGPGAWQPEDPGEFIVLAWVDDQGTEPYGRVNEINENNNMLTAHDIVRIPQTAAAATPRQTPTSTPDEPDATEPPAPTPQQPVPATPVAPTWVVIAVGLAVLAAAILVALLKK